MYFDSVSFNKRLVFWINQLPDWLNSNWPALACDHDFDVEHQLWSRLKWTWEDSIPTFKSFFLKPPSLLWVLWQVFGLSVTAIWVVLATILVASWLGLESIFKLLIWFFGGIFLLMFAIMADIRFDQRSVK